MSPPTRSAFWFASEAGESAWNMAMDEALLGEALKRGGPILRFYGWRDGGASFGYFQRHAEVASTTPLRPLIRRPTGGGIVPHERDWTYSLVFPATDPWHGLRAAESYRRVHEWVRHSFASMGVGTELAPSARKTVFGQCFEGWEQHDVVWNGRKVAGAAQRRKREGLLIQGSIQPPPLQLERGRWERSFLEAGTALEGLVWREPGNLDPLLEAAGRLAEEKYRCAAYTEGAAGFGRKCRPGVPIDGAGDGAGLCRL